MYTSFLMYMVVFLKHEHQSGPQISAPTTWCSDHPQPNLDRRGKRTNVPCKSMGWISDVTFPMDIRELVLGGVRFPVFLHIQGYHFLPLALAFWLSWLISNVAARVMSCCDHFFFFVGLCWRSDPLLFVPICLAKCIKVFWTVFLKWRHLPLAID